MSTANLPAWVGILTVVLRVANVVAIPAVIAIFLADAIDLSVRGVLMAVLLPFFIQVFAAMKVSGHAKSGADELAADRTARRRAQRLELLVSVTISAVVMLGAAHLARQHG